MGELVTLWLSDADVATSSPPTEDFSPAEPDLSRYRAAVGELVAEVGECGVTDGRCAETILARRLDSEPFTDVLSAGPDGADATIARLLFEVRNHEPGPRSARGIA